MQQRIGELWHNIWPPRRGEVSLRSATSLIVFIVAFFAIVLGLELSHTVLFANPWAFGLIIVTPWLWWLHRHGFSGLRGFRGELALATRLILAGLFIMVLAQPRSVRQSDELAIMFAVDLSASIGNDPSEDALRYVTGISAGKPERDQMGLVTFGRDAAVELPPSIIFPFEAVNLQIDRDGTNIERALSLAAAMLPDDKQGRVVLISDGAQTEGASSELLDDLKARGIAVDVLPVSYAYDHEVWVERLELPRNVKRGETYEAAVIMSSMQAGEGELVLRENEQIIFREQVEFRAGKNRFVVPIYLREAGFYEYEASIEVARDKDGLAQNNRAISYLYLRGEGRVLVVVNPAADRREWQPLVDALRSAQREAEVVESYLFPDEAIKLEPYDCVIFANVPADAFVQTQMQALRNAVYNQGIGFVMVGGDQSYGPGGYHRTVVEEALPVSMDVTQKKVLPKGALAIVLHTCEFANGNTIGKEIAKKAIEVLGAQDEAGVLIYDWNGGDKWLFDLTPVAQYDTMAKSINGAQIGDMPAFGPTMQLALTSLQRSDASAKHMIIISDGDPQPPAPNVLAQFQAASISISTVSIFPHGGWDIATLENIAKATSGRYYAPTNANQLPAIFVKEAKTLKRSMLQNKTFTPQIDFPSPIVKGIEAMPQLHGYVLTTAKARATTIMRDPDSEDLDPILVTWRFGLGKTAAWTSDLSPRWASDWVDWSQYEAFVKQLVSDISRATGDSQLRMQVFPDSGTGQIIVEDYAPQATFLEMAAEVQGPRGQAMRVPLRQTGPNRYEGDFPLAGQGNYQVMAVGAGNGRTDRVHGGFVVPYSAEYLRFRANPILLEQIQEKTGGRMLAGTETGEEIFSLERTPKRTSQPIFDWFLLALALLIPLDVAVRRIQLDMEMVRNALGLNRREASSGQTMGSLLDRKKAVAQTMQGDASTVEPERRLPTRPALRPRSRPTTTPGTTGTTASSPPPRTGSTGTNQSDKKEGDTSTTSRLLDLKRKRSKGDEQ